MTVRAVLRAVGRRWYVFAATVFAAGALTFAFYTDGGSFATKTTVTFSAPEASAAIASATTTDSGVIAFAGAVAAELNQGRPVQTYASSDAPYYGAGVREGVMVSLRSVGSQWVASFPSATIDVQIVGRTREWVRARQESILADLISVAEAQQESVVTSPSARISVAVDPLSTQIVQVSSTRTTQLLAVGAMATVALLVGGTLSVIIDQGVRAFSRTRVPRSDRASERAYA